MSETSRTHLPIDYEEYAPTYAWSRAAVPWVLDPLQSIISSSQAHGVLEIGCGTGNYVRALSGLLPNVSYYGVDLSANMLREANAFGARVGWTCADAEELPFRDGTFQVAFAVDVIHHIENLPRFFTEARRILTAGGTLVIATDSEQTLRRRSLTRFFPEILPLELARYPSISHLHEEAQGAGLEPVGHDGASGYIALDEAFLRALAAKCSSAMRLITPEEHIEGMKRVKEAGARGDKWFSCYDLLQYTRPA